MDLKKSHGRVVPKALRERNRVYDIREQNGPDSRVALVSRAAGNESGARTIDFTSPRNPSAISGATSIIFSVSRPCASGCTEAAASGLGALQRQKILPQLTLNQSLC
jgi:hypothetical protein